MSDTGKNCRFCDLSIDNIYTLNCDKSHGFCLDCLNLINDVGKFYSKDYFECPLCQKEVERPKVTNLRSERQNMELGNFVNEELVRLLSQKEIIIRDILQQKNHLEQEMNKQVDILLKEVNDYYSNLNEKLNEHLESFLEFNSLTLRNDLSKKFAKTIEEHIRSGVENTLGKLLKFEANDFQHRFSIGSLNHWDQERIFKFNGEIVKICLYKQKIVILVFEGGLKNNYSVYELENGKQPKHLLNLDGSGRNSIKMAGDANSDPSIYLLDTEKSFLYNLDKRGIHHQLREVYSTEKKWSDVFCINDGLILIKPGSFIKFDYNFEFKWKLSIDDDDNFTIEDSKLLNNQLFLLLEDTSVLIIKTDSKALSYANLQLDARHDLSVQDHLIPKIKRGYCCLSNSEHAFIINPSNYTGIAYRIPKKLRNYRLAYNRVFKDKVFLYFIDSENNLIIRNFS